MSGNPGGRPRGSRIASELVGKATRQGKDLIEFWVRVLKGEEGDVIHVDGEPLLDKEGNAIRSCALKERLKASELLADRRWGKAAPLTEEKPEDKTADSGADLSDADLEAEMAKANGVTQ